MNFIKLHTTLNNETILINLDNIIDISVNSDGRTALTILTTLEEGVIFVTESLSAIETEISERQQVINPRLKLKDLKT